MTTPGPDSDRVAAFVRRVADEGGKHYRDLPWRETRDPYAVLVSEVMLQQTQASRVLPYFERWMAAFPCLETLAGAPLEAVLREWQGLGYNRRAVALKRAAEILVAEHDAMDASGPAAVPADEAALLALPGVGPATAAGVRAFAFGVHAPYLETNVRAVFLHELFADSDDVPDRVVVPLVVEAAACADAHGIDARTWNFALLDYGAHLKRSVPNPSRRSAHHVRQSPFEGSSRQKRARLLRAVIANPGATEAELAVELDMDIETARSLLEELAREGFVSRFDGRWSVA